MAYAPYISTTRHSHSSHVSLFGRIHMHESGKILRICIVCVALLGFLYVSETNALMFLKRTMPAKERTVLEVKNNVRALEIQATQLAASQTVQEEAVANAMVSSREVRYVNDGNNAVAMALPSVR